MAASQDAASTNPLIVPADDRPIFISYCRRDKAFVQQLCAELEKHDRKAWVDWTAIPPLSPNFLNDIKAGIEESYSFAFVLSPAFVESPYCRIELDYAIEQNKRLVPILHQDVVPETLPEVARLVNWLMFRETDPFDAAFATLLKALDTDLEWTRSQAYLNRRAREWEDKQRGISFLLRGSELKAADGWLAKAAGDNNRQPTALQAEYILASNKYAARSQRTLLSVVSAGLVLSVVLALFAVSNYFKAEQQTKIAKGETHRAVLAEDKAQKKTIEAQSLARQRQEALVQANQSAAKEKQAASNEKIAADAARLAKQKAEDETENARRERNAANDAKKRAAASAERATAEADNANHLLYNSNMALIQREAEKNNLRYVRELLKQTRHSNERNVEWGYWNACIAPELITLKVTSFMLNVAAFSPDGRQIITVSGGSTTQFWDARTGQRLHVVELSKRGLPDAGLSHDCRRIALSYGVGEAVSVKICDARAGNVLQILKGGLDSSHSISACAFSPDGMRILVCSEGASAKIFEVATGRLVSDFKVSVPRIGSAAFSPDGKRILAVSLNDTQILDAATGQLLRSLAGHVPLVSENSFSPDGKSIVLAVGEESDNSSAKVWDTQTGTEKCTLNGAKKLTSASFSPDGERIVTCGEDGANVWEARTGLALFHVAEPEALVYFASFSPDNKRLITGDLNGTVRIWDVRSGHSLAMPCSLKAVVNRASFSADSKRFVMVNEERVAVVRKADTGEQIFALRGKGNTKTASFSNDDRHILTGGDYGAVVWDAKTGQQIFSFPITSKFKTALFSPVDRYIAIVEGSTAAVWDAHTGHLALKVQTYKNVVFSPNGRLLCARDREKIKIWDIKSGRVLCIFGEYNRDAAGMVFSRDGKRLILVSESGEAQVWDTGTGSKIVTLRSPVSSLSAAAFSPDSKYFAAGSDEYALKIWDTQTWHETRTFRGHRGFIRDVCFSPNGKRILTGSDDRTVKVWDVDTTRELLTLAGHNAKITSVSFSPDGRRIMSSDRVKIILWASDFGAVPAVADLKTMRRRIQKRTTTVRK